MDPQEPQKFGVSGQGLLPPVAIIGARCRLVVGEGGGALLRHVRLPDSCKQRLSPGKLRTPTGTISQWAWWGPWGDEGHQCGEGHPWGEGHCGVKYMNRGVKDIIRGVKNMVG